MSNYFQPTKSVLEHLVIVNVDLTEYVQSLKVYETVCKPYLTAQIVLIDNKNVVENLGLVGGEQCDITFFSPPNNKKYSCKLHILNMKGRENPNNIRSQIYTIDLIGKIFFQDRATLVQTPSQNETGTTTIKRIFSNYLKGDNLTVLAESIGFLGDKEAHTINNKKPLTAIQDIMKKITFGKYKTGSMLLFRDATSVKLAPLEYLIERAPSNRANPKPFVQKETWGMQFSPEDEYFAIIAAHAEAGRQQGGRSGANDVAGVKHQGQVVFDLFNGGLAKYKPLAQMISAGSFGSSEAISNLMNLAKLAPNGLGGVVNHSLTNSYRAARPTAPDTKTMGERLYSANARSGPQLVIKVPLQTGINVTVGQGIDVRLIPPVGDVNAFNIFNYNMNGIWLVTDLCHEVHNDTKMMNGVTVLQCVKGGMRA